MHICMRIQIHTHTCLHICTEACTHACTFTCMHAKCVHQAENLKPRNFHNFLIAITLQVRFLPPKVSQGEGMRCAVRSRIEVRPKGQDEQPSAGARNVAHIMHGISSNIQYFFVNESNQQLVVAAVAPATHYMSQMLSPHKCL